MKLYTHPISTTSRPIMMFCADQGVAVDYEIVDLLSGAHKQPAYLAVNPNGMVPALDDDGFVLTESSAILKYLADKANSPAYPKDLKARARVNEIMDWCNTNLYRELGYHLVYPQIFPNHARASEELTRSVIDWGLERTRSALDVMNGAWMLGDGRHYLAGNDITIADYLGAELVGVADSIRLNWARYPNVERWLAAMKALPAWGQIHEIFDGFCASLAEKSFVTIE